MLETRRREQTHKKARQGIKRRPQSEAADQAPGFLFVIDPFAASCFMGSVSAARSSPGPERSGNPGASAANDTAGKARAPRPVSAREASRPRKSRSCDRNFASVWKDYRRNKSNKCEKNFVNGQSGSKTKERLSASNSETRQARTRKIANERPRSKLRYQKNIYESFPEVVTPECFNRGSSQSFACGEPSRTTDTSMRE